MYETPQTGSIPASVILYYYYNAVLPISNCLSVMLVSVHVSVLFHSICLDGIKLGLGSCVATFLESVAHSVYHMLSLHYIRLQC